MTRARTSGWLAAVGAMLLAPGAFAAPAGGAHALPDWSGFWRLQGSAALISGEPGKMWAKGTHDNAPLKPEYEAIYAADQVRALRQGDPNATDVLTDTNTLNCFAGMPRFIADPFGYEFLLTPKETWIISDKEVRKVFTDGRDWPPPDARWPLMLGRSKGHWEGKTLVIETINMRSDMWLDPTPLMLSDQASVIEKIHLVDPDKLENDVTIRDPVKFTHDWSFTRFYVRDKKSEQDWPDDPELCGGSEDRNPIVNGRVTVKLPSEK